MKTAIALIAILSPVIAFAQPPVVRIDNPGLLLPPIYVNDSRSNASVTTSTTGGSAVVNNNPSSNYRSAAQAPDAIALPTAPCRVAGGVSGGWFGGAFGISTSAMDESCDIQNMSNTLSNRGAKAASIQILCLHDNARKALEVTGTKCLIANEQPAEVIKP